MTEKIPWDEAVRLCDEIRVENKKKRLSFQAMQCWGCVTFSKGDPKEMCIANGCNLVNGRYKKAGS